jgi:hypothetical protein
MSGAVASGYVPRIPRWHGNVGRAYWRCDADEFGARLHAPVFPGARGVAVGAIGTVFDLVLCGGVAWAFARQGWTADARTAVAMSAVAGALALFGIWGAVLAGNFVESQRGPVLEFDAAMREGRLPRGGASFRQAAVRRLELVRFEVRGSGPGAEWRRITDLVLVVTDGAGERFELLVRDGSRVREASEALSRALAVPFEERNLGSFPMGEAHG